MYKKIDDSSSYVTKNFNFLVNPLRALGKIAHPFVPLQNAFPFYVPA
jgi:hypothetical protein